MDLHHHVIPTFPLKEGRVLAAVGPLPDGETTFVFFQTGFPSDPIGQVPGFNITWTGSVGGGLQIKGQASERDGKIDLPLKDRKETVTRISPKTDIFRGLNTAMAVWHVEEQTSVEDWLRYHTQRHGLQAVLLVARRCEKDITRLQDHLKKAAIPGLQKVLIVAFDCPLGAVDKGDARLPFYAPDAPGTDRMEVPDPDPRSAPLADLSIFEMMRHLYLAKASGVLNVELSDLVEVTANGTIFEQAQNAPHGLAVLRGRRVYPWGLKKDAQPTFPDHTCRRFDADPGNARWCVAPAKLPKRTIWRLVRIVGADAGSVGFFPYVRCMSLRHPQSKIAEIVPKSSLIEDAGLIKLMAENFDANPRRAPKETLKALPKKTGTRTGIVTCMKNEGPFILEWLAYHRAIGVQDFLVYTNDCTDGTDTFLQMLQNKGYVQHRENPFREMQMKPQHGALLAAEKEPLVQSLDWVISMDVDEFINIHVGKGHLSDLFAATGDANMISMTWRLFGNSDVAAFRDEFIIEAFTSCAEKMARKPHQAWGFKTLMQPLGIFKKLGVHRPKGLRPQLVDEIRWVNGSGMPMPRKDFRNAWRSTSGTVGYDLVTLNHYALRSAESFLVKRDRGRVNHVDRDQGLNYWFRMNHNTEQDFSIQRMIPDVRAEFDRLMSDLEIATMHEACVTAHRKKIDELRATEKYTAFYAEITGDRLRKLSRMLGQFGAQVFLNGPDVIPDDAPKHAGDKDYFFTIK